MATELRLATDASAPPPEPLNGVLLRTLRASQAIVSERIRDDAPEAIKDLAVIAVASYVHDRPSAPQGERFANPWRNSGAEQMLSRWIDRRAVAVGGPDEAPYEAPDDAPAPISEPSKSAKGPPLIDATLTSREPDIPASSGRRTPRGPSSGLRCDRFAVDDRGQFSGRRTAYRDGQRVTALHRMTRSSPMIDRLTLKPACRVSRPAH